METEGVETVRLSQSIIMLRGVCNGRFKFAIEYGNKRGTTENTYVIKARHTVATHYLLQVKQHLLRQALQLSYVKC